MLGARKEEGCGHRSGEGSGEFLFPRQHGYALETYPQKGEEVPIGRATHYRRPISGTISMGHALPKPKASNHRLSAEMSMCGVLLMVRVMEYSFPKDSLLLFFWSNRLNHAVPGPRRSRVVAGTPVCPTPFVAHRCSQ